MKLESAAPVLGALLATFFLATPCAMAAGGDLIWTFQGIEDVNGLGVIEDRDADGVPDVVVETYDAGATGDHLYLLSGGSPGPVPVILWSTKPFGGVSSGGGWGNECLRMSADLSGDGLEDVLLGTAWGGRTAYGIDGNDGSVIWDFDTYVDKPPDIPASGWVYTICSVPDTDGDAIADVFFGCGSNNDRAYHVSGADGEVLWSVNLGDAVYTSEPLDDVSGDSIADVAIGVGDNANAVWCMRGGATLTPTIWTHPMPGSVQALARIDDISGDAINDVLVGTWNSRVFAFNGATGDTIWEAALPGFANVMDLAVLDDVSGDTVPDVAVGTWDDRAFVLSGADGTEIWSFPTSGDVWTVSRVEDVNHDGINDVVAGSFDQNVYMLDGVTGAMLWSFATGNRLYTVTGVPDLTGNDGPDVLAGSQKLSGPGGHAYLLEGGDDDPTAVGTRMIVTGTPMDSGPARGAELNLFGAYGFRNCRLERHEGASNERAAARRYRQSISEAYRDGLLTAPEAILARTGDPQIQWSRVSATPIAIVAGHATTIDRAAAAGHTYTYRFAFVQGETVLTYSPSITVVMPGGVSTVAIPELTARPNPSMGAVTIEFTLPYRETVNLDVHDASGRRVATIQQHAVVQGDARFEWDGRGDGGNELASGVYFLRLEGENFVAAQRVTLLR